MFLDESKGVLKVSGEDRCRFLQGLITNDISSLKNDTDAIYTAILSPKGRYLYDFFIVTSGEDMYIVGQNTQAIYTKIKPYKLRLDVHLELFDAYKVYGQLDEKLSKTSIAFQDPRHIDLPMWLLSEAVLNADTNISEYHQRRFDFVVPESADLEHDKSIILEWGFERLNGISFTKGCYMGQELMSRTKHLGEIRKRLMLLRFSQDEGNSMAEVGGEVVFDGHSVGSVKAVHKQMAMALIRVDKLSKNHNLVPVSVGDISAVIVGFEG